MPAAYLYSPTLDFSDWQAANPGLNFDGADLDVEFNNISQAFASLLCIVGLSGGNRSCASVWYGATDPVLDIENTILDNDIWVDSSDPASLVWRIRVSGEWSLIRTTINSYTVKEITTTTYTLVASDVGKYLRYTNALGCVVTIPDGVFTEGDRIDHMQAAAGDVSFALSGTDTFNSRDDFVTIAAKGVAVSTLLGDEAAGEWDLIGALKGAA